RARGRVGAAQVERAAAWHGRYARDHVLQDTLDIAGRQVGVREVDRFDRRQRSQPGGVRADAGAIDVDLDEIVEVREVRHGAREVRPPNVEQEQPRERLEHLDRATQLRVRQVEDVERG